ncbi:MAG: Ig-like domain-containing protein [Candidatus Saccharimonadales bacterium]
MGLQIGHNVFSKPTPTTLVIAVFALILGTISFAAPQFFSRNVFALSPSIDTPVEVTQSSPQGFSMGDTRSNGHLSFMTDSSALNTGALHLITDANPVNGQDKAQFVKPVSALPLSVVLQHNLGYSTKQNSTSFNRGLPSYQMEVLLDGTAAKYATLVYEPYNNVGVANIHKGEWQTWDVAAGKFWITRDYTPLQKSQGEFQYTLPYILSQFPNAVVISVGTNVGSNNPAYDTEVDGLSFNGNKYDFEPTELSAPTSLTPSSSSYTNNPSFDNTWSAVAGAVKYQYETTYNNDQYYTDTSDAGNYVLGGSTIIRHNNNSPQASYTWRVRGIDVNGNFGPWSTYNTVTVDSINPTIPELINTTNNGFERTNDFYFTWTQSIDTNSVKYEFQSSSNGSIDNTGSLIGAWNSITNGDSEQNNLTSPKIHSTGAPDGTYYWQVRAIDVAGNKSPWTTPWKMTIDSAAPAAPQNLTLKDSHNNVITNNGATGSSDVTISWIGVDDAAHYEYKYWNNIPSSAYNTEASAYIVDNGQSLTRSGTFNQGEGTHYIQVRAIDSAGNVSAWSSTFTVVYDVTAAVLTIDPSADTTDTTPTITGTTTHISQPIVVTVDTIEYDATINPDGTWTITVSTPIALGTHTITATSKDEAGNISSVTSNVAITEVSAPLGDTISSPILALAQELPATTIVTSPITGQVSGGNVSDTATTNDGNTSDVLGAQTKKSDTTTPTEVVGTIASTSQGWKIFGLLWYWWLLIAALALVACWLLGARRRSAQDV